MTNTEIYGGYRLVSLRTLDAREGMAFSATITRDGVRVMQVRNGGDGGSHSFNPIGSFRTRAEVEDGFAAHAAVLAAFEVFAADWNMDSQYAGIEDADALVWRLIEVAELNRKRGVIFLIDGQDFWTDGLANQFQSGVTYDQAVVILRTAEYAARSPRIWDRQAGTFVAVV